MGYTVQKGVINQVILVDDVWESTKEARFEIMNGGEPTVLPLSCCVIVQVIRGWGHCTGNCRVGTLYRLVGVGICN